MSHGMGKNQPRFFKHRTWTPSDLQGLSGLSPVNLRDLRRRELVPKNEARKFKLETVAHLLILVELTAHGFGPKSVKQIAEQFSDDLRRHALQHRSAWTDDRSHSAWLKSAFGKRPEPNFVLIKRADEPAIPAVDIAAIQDLGSTTVTVIDLGRLGARLGEHLAHRPSTLITKVKGTD